MRIGLRVFAASSFNSMHTWSCCRFKEFHENAPSFHTPCLWRFGLPGSPGIMETWFCVESWSVPPRTRPRNLRHKRIRAVLKTHGARHPRVRKPGNHANGQRYTIHPEVQNPFCEPPTTDRHKQSRNPQNPEAHLKP